MIIKAMKRWSGRLARFGSNRPLDCGTAERPEASIRSGRLFGRWVNPSASAAFRILLMAVFFGLGVWGSAPAVQAAPELIRLPDRDFTLTGDPDGFEYLWSDGTTVWVTYVSRQKVAEIRAYTLATGTRNTAREFNLDAINQNPAGLWSDKTTLWVIDGNQNRIFAYVLATGARDLAKDINLGSGNYSVSGLWSDGTMIWAKFNNRVLHAYSLATGIRVSQRDIDLTVLNVQPQGFWSDGTTMWVLDTISLPPKLFAYVLANGNYHQARNIDLPDYKTFFVTPPNYRPQGVWSDGETWWVLEDTENKLYAFNMIDDDEANRPPTPVGAFEPLELNLGEGMYAVMVRDKFNDPDEDDPLTFTAGSQNPAVATVSVVGDELVVLPVKVGSTSLLVTATDLGGLTATQAISVMVDALQGAPVAANPFAPAVLFFRGGAETIDLADKFSDLDGDPLIYTAVSHNTDVVTVAVGGSRLNLNPLAMGSAQVFVAATDPGGLSAVQKIDVSVLISTGEPVAVGGIAPLTLTIAGGAMTVDVANSFIDPDGDSLFYDVSSSDPRIVTAGVNGSEVTLTPVAAGKALVTITASDPGGLSAAQRIQATVETSAVSIHEAVKSGVSASVWELINSGADVDMPDSTHSQRYRPLHYAAANLDADILRLLVDAGADATATNSLGKTAIDIARERFVSIEGILGAQPNRAPTPMGSIPALTVSTGMQSEEVELATYFSDSDEDVLIYAARTAQPAVAAASVTGDRIMIKGLTSGATTVTVTAWDPGGSSASQTFRVTVSQTMPANRPPAVALAIAVAPLPVGGSDVTVDLSDKFSDLDGDMLTYGVISSDTGVVGATIVGNQLRLTPGAAGLANLVVTAIDPGGLRITQSFMVRVEAAPSGNRAPAAVGTVPSLNLIIGQATPDTVEASTYFQDPDGDKLSFRASSSNNTAAAVIVEGSKIHIFPVLVGDATITITATDPAGLTGTQTFGVVVSYTPVANRAPLTAAAITAQSLIAGGDSVTFELANHFRDSDGDALTYTAESDTAAVAMAAIVGGELMITPLSSGEARITVRARDPGGLTASQAFTVTVQGSTGTGNAPVLTGIILPVTLLAGGNFQDVNLSSRFRDPDGDALTYTASSSSMVVVTTLIDGDNVKLFPVSTGTATVTVTARDSGGLTVGQTFTVTVRGTSSTIDIPVASGTIPPETLYVGGDFATLDVADKFTVPQSGSWTFSVVSSDNLVVSVSLAGSQLSLFPVLAGEATVTVKASNADGLSATQSFMVTVSLTAPVNRAPMAIGSISAVEFTDGDSATTVDLQNRFDDPDGDRLTFTAASNRPTVATAAIVGTVVRLTPAGAGTAVVTVTARDSGGASATQRINVTVKPPASANDAPAPVGAMPTISLAAGGRDSRTVNVAPYFSDPDGDALTYTVESNIPTIALVQLVGSNVSVYGIVAGRAVVTVTAADPGGLTAAQSFVVVVGGSVPVDPGPGGGAGDYDRDNDGLIEINSLAQLNAVRWDLDGDGSADDAANNQAYAEAFPNAAADMGCLNGDCDGYELSMGLDFGTIVQQAQGPWWNRGLGWEPIGMTGSRFTGTFEGNGNTITNLYINRPNTDYVGLFRIVGRSGVGQVNGLGFSQANVNGRNWVGVLTGLSGGAITACYAEGTIRGNSSIGGLIGYNTGNLSVSYSKVRVTGTNGVGGAIGWNRSGAIAACYATGAVTGTSNVGGLTGLNNGSVVISYSLGAVSGGNNTGGLAGSNAGTITGSYFNTQTSGQSDPVMGKTTAQLQGPTDASGIFDLWDQYDLDSDNRNDAPWDFRSSTQYPALITDFNLDLRFSWEEFGNQ